LTVRLNLEKTNQCNNIVITQNKGIMEISVIRIGNSKGIRLSKALLDRYNIKDTVDLILEKGQIVLRPTSTPRKGWEKSFKEMNDNGDDRLLFSDVFEDENLEEWK
jgi:antitoxin MazE